MRSWSKMPAYQNAVLSPGACVTTSGCEDHLANLHGVIHSSKREKVATINQVIAARQEKTFWSAWVRLVTCSCHKLGTRRNERKKLRIWQAPDTISTAMSGKKQHGRVSSFHGIAAFDTPGICSSDLHNLAGLRVGDFAVRQTRERQHAGNDDIAPRASEKNCAIL